MQQGENFHEGKFAHGENFSRGNFYAVTTPCGDISKQRNNSDEIFRDEVTGGFRAGKLYIEPFLKLIFVVYILVLSNIIVWLCNVREFIYS